jgi:hypothetical protein
MSWDATAADNRGQEELLEGWYNGAIQKVGPRHQELCRPLGTRRSLTLLDDQKRDVVNLRHPLSEFFNGLQKPGAQCRAS